MPLPEARQHLARGAWNDARAELETVLASEPACAEALEGLGWALFWLDDPEASFARREEAYRLYLDRGDKAPAARVATGMAVDAADVHGLAVASGWLQRARTLLGGLDAGPEHGWLALWEGHFARMFEHDLDRALEHALRAQELARTFGLGDLELLGGALEGLVKVTAGDVRDGMRQLDEAAAAAVAGEFSDLDAVANTCCLLLHACERVRDYDRAAQWGDRIEALSGRWHIGSVFVFCQVEHAAMMIGRGEYAEAERELEAALATIEVKRPLAAGAAAAQLGDLRRRQGRIDEALALFARAEGNTLAILGQAAIALDRGEAERCGELVDRLHRRRMAEKWVERAIALELLVRARRDAEAMRELRETAQKLGTDIIRAIGVSAEAVMTEDAAERRRCLEDAVDLFERARAPYEAARARLDLSTALRMLGREQFAREELVAARDAFRRLGAVADEARAEALLRDIVPSRKSTAASPLTKRETEVLRLVARGMSDKEVAASLHLSEHTVHRHVANILGKLDVSSRAAAVGMAVSGHLLE